MSTTLLVLLFFATIALAVLAVGLIARDLTRSETVAAPRLALRPRAADLRPTDDMAFDDRVDLWLRRMVVESRLPFDAITLALLIVLAGVVLAAALFLWNGDIFAAVVGVIVGVIVAIAGFEYYRARRLDEVLKQLPGVVDQIARAVRAGESLDQALAIVAARLKAPLGPELRTVCKQMQMGLPLSAALQQFYRRVPLVDVQILVSTLTIYRDIGGNLASTLERMAAMMRDRYNFRRQVKATTAAGRMAAAILVIVTPTVFLYFYFFRTVSLMRVFDDSLGLIFLAAAVVLEVIGLIWVWNVIRLKY